MLTSRLASLMVVLLTFSAIRSVKEDVLNNYPFISKVVGRNTPARLMINWLAGMQGDPIDVDEYTAMMTEVLTKSRSKEFELITFYMRTYEKDMVSKCKVAMKDQENLASELYFLYERCDGFGRFIGNHLHITPAYFHVASAFKFFFDMLTSGLFRFDFGESDLEALRRNAHFLEILEERIVSDLSKPLDNSPYKAGFAYIEDFYAASFMRVFKPLLPEGRLIPHSFYINKDVQNLMDLAYGIPLDVVRQEKERIKNKDTAEGNESYRVLTRYYRGERGMPLYNFNVSFKLNKNQPL